ncbi:hypothetical protein [Sphingomicrobium astaxanthinifaciens]|uniref:hypothetical protein n=1 Tax=Sphingomicrobium astaxanthinifaciens TaxID=1227949 RepID=UPI001FCB18EF|nr:hypothetical protein [Sphingomicrobium astaxanthinifaciens]MCJ7421232.1 hypothetical protein [Sphingomicrobium astaxanthinifaciens]
MDADRRKELEARRAAMHARAEAAPRGQIADWLSFLCVPHQAANEGIWTPPHVSTTATRLYWEDSPPIPPEDWDFAHDPAEKVRHVRRFLEEVAVPETILTFAYDAMTSNIRIRLADAQPVLGILLDETWTVWVTARPACWLIEAHRDGTVRLSRPPRRTLKEEAAQRARERAHALPMIEALEAAGEWHMPIASDDPRAPDRPRFRNGYRKDPEPTSINGFVEHHQFDAMRARVFDWLAARVDEKVVMVWDGYPAAPYVAMAGATLLRHFDAFMRMLEVEVDNPDGIPIQPRTVTAWAPGENWSLQLDWNGPMWKYSGLD